MITFVGHSVSDLSGRILTMDGAVCDFLHRSHGDLIGRSYTELTHAADRVRNVAEVATLTDGGKALLIRKRYIRPDGAAVAAAVQVSRLTSGADGGRLFGTIFAVAPAIAPEARHPRRWWEAACRARDAMRLRREVLGDALFADHSWMLLVEVFLAEVEGRIVTAPDLAARIDRDVAAVWRLLQTMEYAGMIELVLANGFAVQLTGQGVATLERVLAAGTPEPSGALAVSGH